MRRRIALGLVGLALALAPASADGQSLEYPVKAAYLVRFGGFVNWPPAAFAAASSPVVICVQGPDPFGGVLDRAAAAQTIGGRPVRVLRLARVGPRDGCHIAYLGGSPEQSAADAVGAVSGTPVLTVTDGSRGGAEHGVVRFTVVNNRVRFSIDAAAAARSRLTVSSRLLSLAVAPGGRG